MVVVDEDINIYDHEEVEWTIVTRMRPDRDIIIFNTIEPQPDALIQVPINMYKWGIDATVTITKERWLYKRAIPPGVDKVDFV